MHTEHDSERQTKRIMASHDPDLLVGNELLVIFKAEKPKEIQNSRLSRARNWPSFLPKST